MPGLSATCTKCFPGGHTGGPHVATSYVLACAWPGCRTAAGWKRSEAVRHRACGRICYVGPASTGGRGAVAAWLVVRFSAAVSGVRGGALAQQEGTTGCGRAQKRQIPQGAGGHKSVKYHYDSPQNTTHLDASDRMLDQGGRARWIRDQTSVRVRHPYLQRNAGQRSSVSGNWGAGTELSPRSTGSRIGSAPTSSTIGAGQTATAALLFEIRCRTGRGSFKAELR